MLSTYCQTSEESVGTDSEDFLLFSRNELLHLLLDVLLPIGTILGEEAAGYLLCGFA